METTPVEHIEVRLGSRSYPIHIGTGLLDDDRLLRATLGSGQILVVSNETVAPLYYGKLERALGPGAAELFAIPDGERHKTLETFAHIVDRLIEARFHRDARIVALGGGVVGDVAGFAAAAYQRGIDFIQIPTTLLAQVDSAVGGKTGVNHPSAKNMIGAFHQPAAVIADTGTLATLPSRELAAGLAEVIKYGLIADAEFFAWLEANIDALTGLEPAALVRAIRRSCEIKADIVAEDELERGRRALLNFGHTFGHALESAGRYERWLHGEAVAIGMQLAARTSQALGWLDAGSCARIAALLERAGLPSTADGVTADDLLERMQLDKKAGRAGLKLVLLESIGRGTVTAAPAAPLLREVLQAGTSEERS